MLRHHQGSALLAERQGEVAMKLPQDPVVLSILIVCITLLVFTWLTRSSLCELRLKDGGREIAAKLACGSSK